MGLAQDIVENLTGFSKAMYSTWFFYRPARILFDSGEGVSTALDNFSFGIEQVFLSHGHYDHIGGLPGLVHARNSARGDKEKALKVLYPDGDNLVQSLRDYIDRVSYRLSYPLEWQGLEPGEEVELRTGGRGAFVRAFATRHSRSASTLGYAVMERRTRLKPEYSDLSQAEIRNVVQTSGRDQVMELYEKKLLVYGGDSLPLNPEDAQDAEVLIHDATFLNRADREEPTHATTEEAIKLAREAGVKLLILHHVSSRYHLERIRRRVSGQVRTLAPDLEVLIAHGRSFRAPGGKSKTRATAG